MRRLFSPRTAQVVGLAVGAIVLASSIALALRQSSWVPIWSVGWLPAVLVAVFYRPAGRCEPHSRHRPT